MQDQTKKPHLNNRLPKAKTPKRLTSSIKKESILPADFNYYTLPFSCEDCSHFHFENESCTLGLQTEPHLKRNQLHSYNTSGKMALCRFQEID